MTGVVYDAAVLIAADRGDRRVWADHKARLQNGDVPVVPATVLAQVSRSSRQAALRLFLRGCVVVALDEAAAHATGRLLGAARRDDVVDASVVVTATARRAAIVTADGADIEHLVRCAGAGAAIVAL